MAESSFSQYFLPILQQTVEKYNPKGMNFLKMPVE